MNRLFTINGLAIFMLVQIFVAAASAQTITNDRSSVQTNTQTSGERVGGSTPSTAYIWNGQTQQLATFNISGNGVIGGNASIGGGATVAGPLTVNGDSSFGNMTSASLRSLLIEAETLNAKKQLSIDGLRVLHATGTRNLFAGFGSGSSNTSGVQNSFFGSQAGTANTEGAQNSFFGEHAGNENTTGSENAFFGIYSGLHSLTGHQNSFFGGYSGISNTSGGGNSFFGALSGYNNTTGIENTFLGTAAGYATTSGKGNVAVGTLAGVDNTTGEYNVFVGRSAGAANHTGKFNIYMGFFAGSSNPDGENNTAIGASADVLPGVSNATAIGYRAVADASNSVVLGRQEDTVKVPGALKIGTIGTGGYLQVCINSENVVASCSSSARYKKDVADFKGGMDMIERLRPVTFAWKLNGTPDLGFVAEEVNKVEPLLTTVNERGEVEGVKYDRIGAVLVNAVKEQQEQINVLKREVETLKKLISESNAKTRSYSN